MMAFKIPEIPKLKPRPKPSQLDIQSLPMTSFSELELSKTIGSGSFGKVSLCKKGGTLLIIKELMDNDEENQRLFVKEAKLMNSMNHPNIVNFNSFLQQSEHNKCAFLMEYMHFDLSPFGYATHVSSLKELLLALDNNDYNGFEHFQEKISKDVCCGLNYLHSNNVVHRDLKPDNILVSNAHYSGTDDICKYWVEKPVVAKLTDFGESRSKLIQTASARQTRTSHVNRGSPVYMAPEIHQNEDQTPKSIDDLKCIDIWALGMTFYMLLNPNVKYPYEKEINDIKRTGITTNLVQNVINKGELPSHDLKYQTLRDTTWKKLTNVYDKTAQFSVLCRPTVQEICKLLNENEADTNIAECQMREHSSDDREGKASSKCNQMSAEDEIAMIGAQATVENAQLDQVTDKTDAVFGDFHQASPSYFTHQAIGTQCTMNCLVSILKSVVKDPTKWTNHDINEILIQGDKAHMNTLRENRWLEKRQEHRLSVDELPDMLCCEIENKTVQADICVSKESQYGFASSIARLLKCAITKNPCNILRMYGKCRAVMKSSVGKTFFVFDPHSCGKKGQVDPQGAACLLTFKSLDDLIHHLEMLVQNLSNEQIDITPIDVKLIPSYTEVDENNEPTYVSSENKPDMEQRQRSPTSTTPKKKSLHTIKGDKPNGPTENQASISISSISSDEEKNLDIDTSSCESSMKNGNAYNFARYRNTTLNPSHWNECTTESVEFLPYDIDGTVKFSLQADRDSMMKVTKDGRPWAKWYNSSRSGFHGIRRVAKCNGSMKCQNPTCPYLVHYGYENKVQFQKISNVSVCFTCGVPSEKIACPAVKIWEYGRKSKTVMIMHKGNHKCVPKKMKISKSTILKAIRENPSAKPSKLVNDKLVNMMATDFNWDELEKVAESFVDLKHIHNVKDDVKKNLYPTGENFEALALYKRKCDEKDPFYIFKINNKDLNGKPSYVFKSCTAMASLACAMDKDLGGILKDQYAFIDAKHDRTRHFKTITLWTYHPVLRKLLCLAKMEVENENTENLITFWTLFNNMLNLHSGTPNYMFNPVGFVADENHANWKSIEHVFGKDVVEKVVSCEFHYKQSVQRHSKKLESSKAEEFIKLSNDLLEALTVSEFDKRCKLFQNFLNDNPTFSSWFNWWYDRRTHIFKAFKPALAPASNLAEIGHAKLQSVGRSKMSLLESAREDVALAIRQDAEIRLFASGDAPGGRGPNQRQQMRKNYKKSMKMAVSFGEELDQGIPSIDMPKKFVPVHGKHRPPEKRIKKINYTFHLIHFSQVINLRICYGCKREFKAKYKREPNDLILKHYCHRTYRDKKGVQKLSKDPQATYYHLKLDCTRKEVPTMEIGHIIIHDEIRVHLTDGHRSVLKKFGMNV